MFIACSLYSFRYVYHIFISYISYSSTYHLIHYLSNGSYSISYSVHVIFLYIYYFHGYILYHLLCSIFMYCHHVLFSYTVFMYCVHVLISYTVFLFYFSYYFLFHIGFSDHFTFLYIFIYHVGLYNLMLQNLSSHSSAMLHIISFHMSYSNHLFYVSCLHKP